LYYFYPVAVIDDMGGMTGTGNNVEIDLHRHTIPSYTERAQQTGDGTAFTDFLLFSIELNVHGTPRK
jgi:hypothetical protein